MLETIKTIKMIVIMLVMPVPPGQSENIYKKDMLKYLWEESGTIPCDDEESDSIPCIGL